MTSLDIEGLKERARFRSAQFNEDGISQESFSRRMLAFNDRDLLDSLVTALTTLQAEREALQRKVDILDPAAESFHARMIDAEARALKAENALEPLAVLKLPKWPEGNAGFYSIRFADIERARAALNDAPIEAGKGK